MAKLCERLKEALQLRDMKPSVLSYKTGISEASISHYLAGHYEPKTQKIKSIANALRVSDSWLSGYDVPMNLEEKTTETLPRDKQLLLDLYDKVDENDRELVINMIKAALKKEGI